MCNLMSTFVNLSKLLEQAIISKLDDNMIYYPSTAESYRRQTYLELYDKLMNFQ